MVLKEVFGPESEIGFKGFVDPLIRLLANRKNDPVLKVNSIVASIVSPFVAAHYAFQFSFKVEQSDPKAFDGLHPL